MKFSNLSIIVLLFFSSCSFIVSKNFSNLDGFSKVDQQEADIFLKQLAQENDILSSARGKFEIELKSTLSSKTFKEIFVFQKPDRLRVEFFASALNKLIGLILLKNEEVQFYDFESNALYLGENSRDSFLKITQLPFSAQELMHWLLAKFYFEDFSNDSFHVLRNPYSKQYALLYQSATESKVVLFREGVNKNAMIGSIFIDSLEIRDNRGKTSFYSKFIFENDSLKQIEISVPKENIVGKLSVQQIKYNPDLKGNEQKLFNFTNDFPVRILQK